VGVVHAFRKSVYNYMFLAAVTCSARAVNQTHADPILVAREHLIIDPSFIVLHP